MRYRQLVVLEVFVDDDTFEYGWPKGMPWEQMLREHLKAVDVITEHLEVNVASTTEDRLDEGGSVMDMDYTPGDWRYRHTEPQHCPYYVNVYEVGQGYGGPEEGGWWFSTGDPLVEECLIFETEDAAEAGANLLRAAFPSTRKQYSVNGGEDYEVRIEDHPPRSWPTHRPHYE